MNEEDRNSDGFGMRASSPSSHYTLIFFCVLIFLYVWHIWDFLYDKHLRTIPAWFNRKGKNEESAAVHFTDVEAGRRLAIRRKQEETAALSAIAAEKQRLKDLEELERQAENIKLKSVNPISTTGGGQRLVEKQTIQKPVVAPLQKTITPSTLDKGDQTNSSSSSSSVEAPRLPKVIPLTDSEIAAQRMKIATDRLDRMSSEPSIDAEGVLTLAIRCISWRGELRDERRFLSSDSIEHVADFVQASGAFEADGGMRNAALFTVFPRKCLLDWKDYDLSSLTTKKDFENFSISSMNASASSNGHATLSELGLSGRTVLSLVRSSS